MGYLFRFLCICALGVVPLIGCSETGGEGAGGSGGSGVACEGNVCPCSEAGIRAAIEAGGEDPYTFDCDGAQTVTTRAEIAIDDDVILDGEGELTVDGNTDHRVFFVAKDVTAELRGVTVTRGNGGGIYNDGTLTLTDSTVSGNVAGAGGGITNNEGPLTLINSTVSGNIARSSGGGIANYEGPLTLTNSTVSGNSADRNGGGIYNHSGTLTLTDSTVSGNTAEHGGGFFLFDSGILTLTGSTVSGNSAGYEGGGIHNHTEQFLFSGNGNTVTLTNSTVSENVAGVGGGGISQDYRGTLTLTDSTVSGNSAVGSEPFTGWGGGITQTWAPDGTLTLINSTVSGNTAHAGSGGISWGGSLTLINSTVSGNSAEASGGISGGYNTTLINSTVSRNSAELGGGGITNGFWGSLTLINTTVSGNTAGSRGGGIGAWGLETTLINSTVSGNTASEGSAIFHDDAYSFDIRNSLIAGDCVVDTFSPPPHPTFTSLGHNIESPDDTCGFDQLTDQVNVSDPMLGPLQNNGGPTETHALLRGSVAIDVIPEAECVDDDGEPLTTDQRGVTRPQGPQCDVGAVEMEVTP